MRTSEAGIGNELRAEDELSRAHAGERRRVERVLAAAEACRDLWVAVIDQAVSDLEQLRRLEAKTSHNRYEKELLDRIRSSSPDRFFESDHFVQICDLLGVDSDAVAEAYGLADLDIRPGTGRRDPVGGVATRMAAS